MGQGLISSIRMMVKCETYYDYRSLANGIPVSGGTNKSQLASYSLREENRVGAKMDIS